MIDSLGSIGQDEQILALCARIQQPEPVRDWFQRMLRMWISDQQQASHSTADDVQRELTVLRDQQDGLLNLRLPDEIEADTIRTEEHGVARPHCRAHSPTGIGTSRARRTRGHGAASV